MVTLHAFLALAAGFVTMAILVAVLTALLTRLTPSWVGEQGKPQPGYIFVNLGYSFLAAAAGGYVTALLAAANPLYHVLALGNRRARPRRPQRDAIQRQAADLVSAHAPGFDSHRRPCRRPRPPQSHGHSLSVSTCCGIVVSPTSERPPTPVSPSSPPLPSSLPARSA